MRLKSLKLFNFRNYSELSLDLSFGINIFIGDNGVGKTNILEAIYVLSLTKSNRYGTINDLIKHDAITSKINCLVDYDGYTKEYEIIDSSNLKIPTISENEQKYQELWSTFFNTISIKERTNSRLQMQYMPKKYWKDLVELNN